MEPLHMHGVRVAESLQQTLGSFEKSLLWMSWIGDPKASFFIYFPVTYFLSKKIGISVLWITVITEWLNLTFKWLFFGERPFWWIHESGVYSEQQMPKLKQFYSSCETGPGSPSGHAMITGAAWWVMMTTFSTFIYDRTRSSVAKNAPVVLYIVMLLAIGVSRIFILAHFPHQVLGGIFTGAVLGFLLGKRVPENIKLIHCISTSIGLLLSALGLYWGLHYIGVNVSWTILLATKWCAKPEWIRLDTAPFSSLSRDTGALLGLGLGLSSPVYSRLQAWKMTWKLKMICIVLSVLIIEIMDHVPLSKHSSILFYALFYLKNALVPILVIVIIPWIVHSIFVIQHSQKQQ
ncbi:glucose-6-phosphatase 3 [Chiloscyllium plagiosum]|uniref:glucose-6-phosphatase 3 n=1 Tax=Chiloscyllium plagiosum TaxID=36176 RepID=UPI001CB80786|nr:glucose-6-phosphatase 3 [Chiloscyllium plagiosum]